MSCEWSSLLKRNSHWGKSRAKLKYIVFQFSHYSVTEGKQTGLMLLILLKALLFFTQNPVLLWLLRNWFLERYLVCLFVSQHDMVWDPEMTCYHFSSFMRMDCKLPRHGFWPPPPSFQVNHFKLSLILLIFQFDLQ